MATDPISTASMLRLLLEFYLNLKSEVFLLFPTFTDDEGTDFHGSPIIFGSVQAVLEHFLPAYKGKLPFDPAQGWYLITYTAVGGEAEARALAELPSGFLEEINFSPETGEGAEGGYLRIINRLPDPEELEDWDGADDLEGEQSYKLLRMSGEAAVALLLAPLLDAYPALSSPTQEDDAAP